MYIVSDRECYHTDEIITQEGEADDRLYLILSGSVSMTCTSGVSRTFLKHLNAGALFGTEHFFSISVWTIAVKAKCSVVLQVLSRQSLPNLEQRFPGFVKKLHEYCKGSNYVPDLLKMSGEDRRNSVRYQVSAKVAMFFGDRYGAVVHRTVTGGLHDISQGGFSFSINIANSDKARLLLRKPVQAELKCEGKRTLLLEGIIVSIEKVKASGNSYKVHVKMAEFMTPFQVREALDLCSNDHKIW